jgi:hypothetical protein
MLSKIYSGQATCNWYAGLPPQNVVPANTEVAVALAYPGVSDLTGHGFGPDGRGVWGYCFRGDSTHNPCTEIWGPYCE